MSGSGSSGGGLTAAVAARIARVTGRTTASTSFKIDTSDYLGIDHESYKTKLFQLAITKPEDYFQLREEVLEQVKREAVSTQYDVYYNLLSTGTKSDGTTPYIADLVLRNYFCPSVPLQETNQFALKASKTIDAICEEAIEMLIPMNYKEIAENRLKKRTEGNLGF